MDKAAWERGPWDDEPDHEEWDDPPFHCAIHRHEEFGNLNGYVSVPEAHWAYGLDYDDIDIVVHGGLTYCGDRAPWTNETDPGRWWFGFDTAHAGDRMPGMDATLKRLGQAPLRDFGDPVFSITYKTIEYMKFEIAAVITQLRRGSDDQGDSVLLP